MWLVFTRMAGVIVVFYLMQSLVNYTFTAGGVTKYPLSNQELYWKFMVGLNAETRGTWSMEDAEYAARYKLGEERNQAELAIIKERLADKSAVSALLLAKLVYMRGSADGSAMWSLRELNKQNVIEIQSRYRLDVIPAFMLLQSYGIYMLYEKVQPLFAVKVNKGAYSSKVFVKAPK
jgi:hypothetical protein